MKTADKITEHNELLRVEEQCHLCEKVVKGAKNETIVGDGEHFSEIHGTCYIVV